MNKRQIKRTISDKTRRWRCTSETGHKSEPQNLENGKHSPLEVKVVAAHFSKENLKDGSPPRVRNWRYNRVWRRDRVWVKRSTPRDRVWVKRDTPRQNETLLASKAMDEHRTEKILTRGVVQGRRHKKSRHKDDEQHAKFKHGLPPTVRNWRYNRIWRRDRVWRKTLPQMGASSATKSPKTANTGKHSKSPTVSLTNPNSKVDMSRTDINVDKHATSSAPFSPSVMASPTQTCSGPVPPSADLSLVTVERSQTTIICSGKKTTSSSHDSSLAPCDQVEQPTKITESHPSTDQKKVRASHKRKRPSVRNTPNKRFLLKAPADDTEETSARFEVKAI
ncbi:uncharacterized protein LOC144625298 [Crassostrea virginica]